MGFIRNCIKIEGIQEKFINRETDEHYILYSETSNINIPETLPDIKNIFEIIINVDIKSWKIIDNYKNPIVTIDGLKKYKIIYTENNIEERVCLEEFEMPYNTYIEIIDRNLKLIDLQLNILDAYYQVQGHHLLYEYLLYSVIPIYNIEMKKNKNNVEYYLKGDENEPNY
jgi:hypothetical protein